MSAVKLYKSEVNYRKAMCVMELPIELRLMSEKLVEGISGSEMAESAKELSRRYMSESGTGKSLLNEDREATVYSLMRMPATFGAVTAALEQICKSSDFVPRSLLDAGAGTGTGSWAATSYFALDRIICLEREFAMENIGKAFMGEASDEALRGAMWIHTDLSEEFGGKYKSDLVIASYVLNEMTMEERIKTAEKLWENTNQVLLIVEPGTPVGYENIKAIREHLLRQGANMVAPCPHSEACELEKCDWCHFTCRVQRGKLHKLVKGADVPYEDEKYAYIALSREKCHPAENRIMRHPIVEKGRVRLTVCTKDKKVLEKTVTKRDGEQYRVAKKSACGDSI